MRVSRATSVGLSAATADLRPDHGCVSMVQADHAPPSTTAGRTTLSGGRRLSRRRSWGPVIRITRDATNCSAGGSAALRGSISFCWPS